MRAISIRAPWTWAILRAGKRIENRAWPGLDLMRLPQAIVLHTSLTPDLDSWSAVERASGVRPRFVYRIVFVTPLTGEFQLLLEVERHPPGAEVALGGTVHPWRWDSRGPRRGAA